MAVEKGHIPLVLIPSAENIVSSVDFHCPLDLEEFVSRVPHSKYIPERCFAVIAWDFVKLSPDVTALVFAPGKMIVTGAKSEDLSRIAAMQLTRFIQKRDFPVRYKDFKILKLPVRLENLVYAPSSAPVRDNRFDPDKARKEAFRISGRFNPY